MNGRLVGKVALVTGAGSGLGRAAALRCAGESAKVVCADIDSAAAAGVAGKIASLGGAASVVGVDVSNPADCERMACTR